MTNYGEIDIPWKHFHITDGSTLSAIHLYKKFLQTE